MLDRKKAPSFKRIEKIDIPKAKTFSLDNGLPVNEITAGKQPVVRLELIFKAGAWHEKNTGESYFACKMLGEGTKRKTSANISNEIDKFGAFLDLSPSLDFAVVTIECLSRYFRDLLPILHELIYDSTLPEQEYKVLQNIKGQQIRINDEKNSIIASKKLREILFGHQHPYGKVLTVEAVEHLSLPEVDRFYQENYKTPFEIVLSGLPEADAAEALNAVFGVETPSSPPAELMNKVDSSKRSTVIEKEESVQSSIRIGKRLFTKDHPDIIDVLVFNEILGGYFGSRLMKNIREDKGFTYGISSGVITLKRDGFFIIGTDVKKEHTSQTLEEIYKEILQLQQQEVPEEELNIVKNYMTGSFLSDINTPFALADKFKAVHLNGLDYSYYSRYIERINTIKAREIQDIANRYFQIDTLSEVVVGGL